MALLYIELDAGGETGIAKLLLDNKKLQLAVQDSKKKYKVLELEHGDLKNTHERKLSEMSSIEKDRQLIINNYYNLKKIIDDIRERTIDPVMQEFLNTESIASEFRPGSSIGSSESFSHILQCNYKSKESSSASSSTVCSRENVFSLIVKLIIKR